MCNLNNFAAYVIKITVTIEEKKQTEVAKSKIIKIK